MPRNKNKKKKNSLVYSPESVTEVKKKLKALNKRRLLTILLSTIAVFAVYEALLSLEAAKGMSFSIATTVMFVAVTALTIAVIFLNHGFSKKDFTPDMLREDVPADEAEEICRKLNSHRAIAKKLMLVLTPLMLALLLDIIGLFYGDTLSNIFRFLVPAS